MIPKATSTVIHNKHPLHPLQTVKLARFNLKEVNVRSLNSSLHLMRIAGTALSTPMHRNHSLAIGEELIHSISSLHRSHSKVSSHTHQGNIRLVKVVDQLHVTMESSVTSEINHMVIRSVQNEAIGLSTNIATILSTHTRRMLLYLSSVHFIVQHVRKQP